MHIVPKWSDILLKILQQMLQDFLSVSDQFGTLCIKGLNRNLRIFLFRAKIIVVNLESCKVELSFEHKT